MRSQIRRAAIFVVVAAVASVAAVSTNPEVQQALARGDSALHAGKYQDAIKEYKKAGKLSDNRCSQCDRRLALAYIRTGRSSDALEYCKKAVQCAVDDQERADANNLQGNLYLALANGDSGQLQQAEKSLRNALAQNPDLTFAHFSLARALFLQKHDSEALSEVKAFLASSPTGAEADLARRWQAKPELARELLAPEFHITTLDGQSYTLQAHAGKTVVFDFWATWCPACVASLPEMKELVKKYGDRVVVISISADSDQGRWREFVGAKQMTWPQYFDGNGAVAEQFGVRAFPTYMIVDGDGVIRKQIIGTNPQMSLVGNLKKELATLLDKPTSASKR